MGKIALQPGDIIRHGDLGPWNTLWQRGSLTGLIDWDFAEPGKRVTDLAQMAYYFVPLRGESGWCQAGFATKPDFIKRVQVLCAEYGDFTVDEIIDELKRWLSEEQRRVREFGAAGIEPWVSFLRRGDDTDISADRDWLKTIRA